MRLSNVLLTVAIAGLSGQAYAATACVNGTLADYELLGTGGCTLGAVTIASFTTLTGTTGATPIDPATISITPMGGTSDPELMFSVSQTATAPVPLEAIFDYTISGPAFTMDTISLSGSSETVDGGVTDIQNYCAGGKFGPDGVTGCSGSVSGSLLTLDTIQNTDQTTLSGPTLLSITDDFELDGGTAGTASGGTFTDQFNATAVTSPVPEPGAFLLTATGLALAAWRRLRFHQ